MTPKEVSLDPRVLVTRTIFFLCEKTLFRVALLFNGKLHPVGTEFDTFSHVDNRR